MLTSTVILWSIGMAILGVGIAALIFRIRGKGISVTWYEWLIALIGIVVFLFTVQNFFASFTEGETKAAYMFLLFPGLPALILLAIAWQLVVRRSKA